MENTFSHTAFGRASSLAPSYLMKSILFRGSSRIVATMLTLVAVAACGSGADSDGPRAPVVVGDPLGVAGAHEHGVASLGVAIDGDQVTLDLQVPAASVFGFERAPESEEERASMAAALDRLRSGASDLIAFPAAAACALESIERLDAPEIPEVAASGADDHAEDDDDSHEHAHEDEDSAAHDHAEDDDHTADEHVHAEGAEEAEDAHDESAHDHGEDEEAGDGHDDVRLVATLRCVASPRGAAQLTLGSLLADLEQVDLTVVTAGGQAAARVAADATFEL